MPRATRQPVEVRPLVTGVGLVWARSERLTERYPVFPDLGMEVLRGQFDAQLIGSGEQLARDPDQEGSNRLSWCTTWWNKPLNPRPSRNLITATSPAWLVRFRPPVSERIFGEHRRVAFGFFPVCWLMERVTPQADLISS